MGVLHQALVDGAHAVVRAVEHHARQTDEPTSFSLGDIASTTATAASSTITAIATGTSLQPPLSESPSPSPSPTQPPEQDNGTSSPLLFFVALGFGVVFTNLWIIVGVKYCFRYNARNRQMRGVDENGEPINLENMPARPHRRRREKKLMTMDEVNEKFPMVKYKTWVAGRAREGLPTAGGVSAPASRANSVRSVEGIVPELPSKERDSTDELPNANASPAHVNSKPEDGSKNPNGTSDTAAADGAEKANADREGALTQTQTVQTVGSRGLKDNDGHASDDEDDEHIDAALPPELMGTAGDTCAICIDTLEDDDDVRGLTCGHAFHAVCLDPWLTNRRACCPLCKADYYTPKPRPSAVEGDPNNPTAHGGRDPSRNSGRMNMPRSPQRTLNPWNRQPRLLLGGGRLAGARFMGSDNRRTYRPQRPQRRGTNSRVPENPQLGATENSGWFSRFRGRFPPFRMEQMLRRGAPDGQTAETSQPTRSGNDTNTTPSELEAGIRPSTTPAA